MQQNIMTGGTDAPDIQKVRIKKMYENIFSADTNWV